MILKYGAYAHSPNEASLAITRQARLSPDGRPFAHVERWTITGVKQAASPADLMAVLAALQSAYAADGKDLGLYLDDGVTPSTHRLPSASAAGGTRVISGVEFPADRGGEFSTFRTYRIVIEAEYRDPRTPLIAYQESLSFTGAGGPQFRYLPTLRGPWQRQTVSETSNYFVVQRGQAIGQTAYPAPPAPLWPAAEHLEQRVLDFGPPRRHASGSFTDWPVSWRYVFESHAALRK